MSANLHKTLAQFGTMLIVLSLLLMFSTPMLAEAAGPLCYVDDSAGGMNNGTSWTDAYIDLQSALADAGCTQIWVAAGTYKPTSSADRLVNFVLKNGVNIYGGFAGTETQLEQRNWVANETILSGDLNGDDVGFTNNVENSHHVINTSGTDSSAMLDGFILRGGNANNTTFPHNSGGGMLNDGGSPTLVNLIFNGNTTSNYGGGISNLNNGGPTLTNVTFSSNTADLGGGVYNSSSNPTLTSVTFTSNNATSGGGMCNVSSSPVLTETTFSGNTATNSGGGMYNSASSPLLTNVTFSSNTASNSGGGMSNLGNSIPTLTNMTFSSNTADLGGGVYNSSSNPTLTNVTFNNNNNATSGGGMYNITSSPVLTDTTFSGNTATNYGGGMYNSASGPSLTNVTFSSNAASNSGGGMYNYSASHPTLTNVTFSANTATNYGGGIYNYTNSNPILTNAIFNDNTSSNNGGGIYNRDSSPSLANVTFRGNTAANYGGGIYNRTSSPSLMNITFNGNTASKGGGIYNYSTSTPALTNVTFNSNVATSSGGGMYNDGSSPVISNAILWGDGTEVYNLTSAPTIVDSVIEDGCPVGASCTNVITGDPLLGTLQDNGGYTQTMALGASSSAIDTGGANSTCTTSDQRGVSRPIDGNGDGIAVCDIGAYEYNPPPIYTLTISKVGSGSGAVTSLPSGIDCGEDCSELYALGALVSLTAAPIEGSVFTGWSGDTDCLDGSVIMDASKLCTATFEPGITTLTSVDCGVGVPVVTYDSNIACAVTVTASSGTISPSGTVAWTTNESGSFVEANSCTLSNSGGSASCSITYRPGAVGSGSHLITANYAGESLFLSSSGDQLVTVNPKAASVTPNAAGKSYSDVDPTLTGTLDGFVISDGVIATYSRAAGEAVGTYVISAALSPVEVLHNYTITYDTANFTIAPAVATVTLSDLAQAYDGTPKEATVTTDPAGLSVSLTYDGSTTPPTAVGSYAVVATVTDPNYTGSASGTLIIQAQHSLSLVPGWNLVSFNVHPADTSITAVLADIAGHYDLVYAWDTSGVHSSSGNWLKYDPAVPAFLNSLTQLDETLGFWIHMTAADTLDVAGGAPTSTAIQLLDNAGGWNLVGYASIANRNLPGVLEAHGVGTDYSLVYGYHANEPSDPWKLFDQSVPAFLNDLTQLTPGWGYWIKVNADHTWTIQFLPE